MKRIASLFLLLIACPAFGQSVVLPDSITGVPGQWIVLAPKKVDGGVVKWRFDPALQEVQLGQLLPEEMVGKLKGKVVTATEPGRYKYEAWNAKGDLASDIAVGWVVILRQGPTPVPPPPPVPPDPTPKPPTPSPAPIPVQGFRVLVVFDQTGGTAILSKAQQNELYGAEVAAYLNAKCVKGPDGKTPEWRIWQKDTPLTGASELWRQAMGRHRDNLPWIVISNGVDGYEGPLPDGGIINLLKKWGG